MWPFSNTCWWHVSVNTWWISRSCVCTRGAAKATTHNVMSGKLQSGNQYDRDGSLLLTYYFSWLIPPPSLARLLGVKTSAKLSYFLYANPTTSSSLLGASGATGQLTLKWIAGGVAVRPLLYYTSVVLMAAPRSQMHRGRFKPFGSAVVIRFFSVVPSYV